MSNSNLPIRNLSKEEVLDYLADMCSRSPGKFEIRFIPDSSTFIPESKQVLRFRLCNPRINHSTIPILRERDKRILKLSEEGLTAKEIADRLNVSLTMVKKGKTRIFTELDVSNIRAAISKAKKLGLIF